MIGKCVTQKLKDQGLFTKVFSGDNINNNFGEINCSGNKNNFHALKYELKKEVVSAGCPAYILHNCSQH
jgi:sorbitol-specific phosphotransferase system component IIA